MTKMAEDDIAETTGYLLGQFEIQAAEDFINEIEASVKSLARYPFRAHTPKELKDFPEKSVRELPVFSHRLIFRVLDKEVFVLFVAHGKREIENELIQRAMRFGSLDFGQGE
jgi:toxin ParE1/3/4